MESKTVNYIVAFYGGPRRHYGNVSPIGKFLEAQIEFLKTSPKYITGFSFIFNESNNPDEKLVIQKARDFATQSKLESLIITRPNVGMSYGAWNLAITKTMSRYSHSYLAEEDYLPGNTEFLEVFIEESNEDTKYVCCLAKSGNGWPYHAAIANGLLNNKKAIKAYTKYGKVFDIIDDNTYRVGGTYNQVNFLNYMEGDLLDVADKGHFIFLDSNRVVNIYGDQTKPLLLIPVV